MRSVLKRNGDADKKIWVTEWGVPTNGRPGTYVSEARQAKIYARAVRLWSRYPWGGQADRLPGARLRYRHLHARELLGVLRHDLSPKPVVAVLRRLIARK